MLDRVTGGRNDEGHDGEKEGYDDEQRSGEELPAVLTVDEVAALLRVNRKTIYEALLRGEIPGARRIGRSIRIGRDAVLEWLRGQGHGSRSRRNP